MGFTVYNSDGTVSFPYATVSGSKVSTVTVSVVDKKGSFANLSNYLITDLADSSGNHYCATFKVSNAAAAQTLIRGLKFKNTTADVSVIKVSIDGNTTNISSNANLTEYNGHYYLYISGKMSWSKAYNAAKSLYFQGMQGYLATLTSKAEKTLLSNISTECAWIGGTVIAYNNTNKTKILDASSLTIKKGNFTYMNGPSWPSSDNTGNNATALKYYYWACGPEAGQTCNSNSEIFTSSGEPNVYRLVSSSIDTSTANNTLNLTTWETCLVANNNNDPQVINDINESGRIGSHNAGYFVEFGGYTTDPGKPSSTYKASTSATVCHNHNWSYSASGTTITAKCSVSGCTYGQNVSISVADLVHFGDSYTPFTYSSSATTWSQLGLSAVSAKYKVKNSTGSGTTTVPSSIGEYTITLSTSGKSVSKDFEINHLWSYSTDNNSLVATCTKAKCSYNTSPIILSTTIPDFVHVGDSYTDLDNESTWTTNGCDAVTKLYTGTQEEESYSSSTAPVKRGNFTFTAQVDDETISKDFEINHVWTCTRDLLTLYANCTYENCQYHTDPVKVSLVTNITDLDTVIGPDMPSDSTITWTSSNPSVASVDDNGFVRAISNGNTTIKALLNDGQGLYDTAEFKVLKSYNVTFNPNGGSGGGVYTVPESSRLGNNVRSLPSATKSGSYFSGWYNGSKQASLNDIITANTTYTAKWADANYIKFDIGKLDNYGFILSGNETTSLLSIHEGTVITLVEKDSCYQLEVNDHNKISYLKICYTGTFPGVKVSHMPPLTASNYYLIDTYATLSNVGESVTTTVVSGAPNTALWLKKGQPTDWNWDVSVV